MGSAQGGSIIFGSCASPRAQWRPQTVAGTPHVMVNTFDGHAMAPPLCLGNPCDTRVQLVPSKDVAFLAPLLDFSMDLVS